MGGKKGRKQDRRGGDVRLEVKKSHWDSPYGSILRPTGADGGRLGPSIIGGGDGAPPLTGEGPYESPVQPDQRLHKWMQRWCCSNSRSFSTLSWQHDLAVTQLCGVRRCGERSVTLARACSLSRIGSEERSPTLVELSRQRGQSVGGKMTSK